MLKRAERWRTVASFQVSEKDWRMKRRGLDEPCNCLCHGFEMAFD